VDDNTITWTNITNTKWGPRWPGSLICRRDPGDIISFDRGHRSPTTLDLGDSHRAVFTCSHIRLTIRIGGRTNEPLTKRELARLVLYVCSVGNTCDCFKADWLRLFDEHFCRAAAIETWRWLERTVGHQAVLPCWEKRDPPGREWRVRAVAINDGLFRGMKGRAVPRFPRCHDGNGTRTDAHQRADRIGADQRPRYPMVSLKKYLATED
jgi:hypothetical protein